MRTSAIDETGRILHEGAESAEHYWKILVAEQNRRLNTVTT
jgi:hypothetical protein